MRIHTDHLTFADMGTAAIHAGVILHRCAEHRSQSRKRAFDFYLEGSGRTGGQWGNTGTHGAAPIKAATWDEYGIFIARLYTKDPDAHFGKHGYESEEHFHWVTGNRYRTLTPDQQHKRHRWGYHDRSAGGTYLVAQCTKCPAILRRPAYGYTWEDIAS